MNREKFEQKNLASSIAPRRRSPENYLVVWIDANVDLQSQDGQKAWNELRDVVNPVQIFTEPTSCVEFLKTIDQR